MANDGRNRTTKPTKNQNSQSKGNLQILRNISSEHNETSGDERKNKKGYLWRTKKLLQTKLYCRNLVRYSGPFWSGREKNFNKWTREQENSKRCIWRYVPETTQADCMCQEKVEEDLPTFSQESVDVSIQWLKDYINKCIGRLVTVTRNNANTRINRAEISRKQKCEGKQL